MIADIKEKSNIGRVRYYIDSEGGIAYEKIPDSSWAFALALYSS